METPFSKFIKDNIKSDGLIGVEIGVMTGTNAVYLLEDLPIKRLYLVDNYNAYFSGSGWFTAEQQEQYHAETISKTDKYFEKVLIIKQDSSWAYKLFQNAYFDFVYIDANHDYRNVMDDMNYWWDKCKSGGVFGGHDYGTVNGAEVKKAVDDFIKIKGLVVQDPAIGMRVGQAMEWAFIKP